MKKKITIALIAVILILFCAIPVNTAELVLKFHYSEIDETEPFFLMYTTKDDPEFTMDKRVEARVSEELHTVLFVVPAELKGKLGILRIDFPESTQSIAIDNVSVFSGGVVKKQYDPDVFFAPENISGTSDIDAIQRGLSGLDTYIMTSSGDPYMVFTEDLSAGIARHFSTYTLTKIVLSVIVALFLWQIPGLITSKDRDGESEESETGEIHELPERKTVTGFRNIADCSGIILFGAIAAFLSFRIVLKELGHTMSDFTGHTYVYLPLFTNRATLKDGIGTAPYCMWHMITLFGYEVLGIPLQFAAAYTNSLFAIFSYFVVSRFLLCVSKRTGQKTDSFTTGLLAAGLCILQPIQANWMNTGWQDLVPVTPNPLFNPTYLAMRGFSLLCFGLVVDIWGKQNSDSYKGIFFKVENGLKKYYIWLAVLLCLSVMAKPTFAEMFIPAVGLMMLGRLITLSCGGNGFDKTYFKKLITMFMCAVPAVILILVQFSVYFLLGGSYGEGGNFVITPFLKAWGMLSVNPGLSIILALAFPLFVMLTETADFIGSAMGRLSLTCLVVSFLEAAFFGESTKVGHGDFLWPFMSAMFLLFATAVFVLIGQREGADESIEEGAGKKISVRIRESVVRVSPVAAYILLALHILCGVSMIINAIG